MIMSLEKKISTYELIARYLPAILTAIPLIVLSFYVMQREESSGLISYLLSLKFLGHLSMAFVLLYFYAQIIRSTSKYFENKYFRNAQGFPTTYLMLYSNSQYSEVFKDAFRRHVKDRLGFVLCTKEEELQNGIEAIRRLNEVTKQIILAVGEGVLVGKHNQWYGFFRNLIGGSIYGSFFCIIDVIISRTAFQSNTFTAVSLCLFVVYSMLILARKPLLIQHAEAYARQLLAEFMNE